MVGSRGKCHASPEAFDVTDLCTAPEGRNSKRGEAMSSSFKKIYKEVSKNAAELGRLLPDSMAAFGDLGAATYTDGAISAKQKELIALAIAVTVRCDGCVAFHARAAHRRGASREEVAEAISVALQMGGGPSMVYGGEALAAYDEFNSKG